MVDKSPDEGPPPTARPQRVPEPNTTFAERAKANQAPDLVAAGEPAAPKKTAPKKSPSK